MSDVSRLRPVDPEPVPEVVEVLEQLLVDAKAGKIQGITLALTGTQGLATQQAGRFDVGDALWAMEVWRVRLLRFKGIIE